MDSVDLLFHVHPELSIEQRAKLEEHVRSIDGVVSADFSEEHHHLFMVKYDPAIVGSDEILVHVRKQDPEASIAAI